MQELRFRGGKVLALISQKSVEGLGPEPVPKTVIPPAPLSLLIKLQNIRSPGKDDK